MNSVKMLLDIGETRRNELPEFAVEHLAGQLLTPLTRYTRWAKKKFAVDNGAYSGFQWDAFQALLAREWEARDKCLWVCVPDVPMSARRTREVWEHRFSIIRCGWPLAYVVQNGQENISIPWDELDAIFLGGDDAWKMSEEAAQIIRTATTLRKIKHVGRVNSRGRWKHFEALGVDTCDGTGVAKYDHMLASMLSDEPLLPLFEESGGGTVAGRDKSSTGPTPLESSSAIPDTTSEAVT